MITGSAGLPTVATMVAFLAVVPSVAGSPVYIRTWAFVSRIDCQLMLAAKALSSDYAPSEPC